MFRLTSSHANTLGLILGQITHYFLRQMIREKGVLRQQGGSVFGRLVLRFCFVVILGPLGKVKDANIFTYISWNLYSLPAAAILHCFGRQIQPQNPDTDFLLGEATEAVYEIVNAH